jgi:Mannosylglycerate hydrolase MGH1-like glycoside hydrolase domain
LQKIVAILTFIERIKMSKKWKWQPFTPKVRINAQAVINEANGAALETIFSAGVKVGNTTKFGEVFAEHPGHHNYQMDHFVYSHTIVNEIEYDENNNYWRFNILADTAQKNAISVEFKACGKRKILAKLTAVNKSNKTAQWFPSFMASANGQCQEVKLSDKEIIADNNRLAFLFDSEWSNTPPLTHNTQLTGVLLKWGDNHFPGRYYINFFRKWIIHPGETKTLWALIGDVCENDITSSINDFNPGYSTFGIQDKDDLGKMISHLANQLKLNRAYPPAVKHSGKPEAIFTPGPTWDEEYFWDAGFVAAGLSVFDPQKAEECIAQYIPFSKTTVYPNFYGGLSLVQVAATWELYQNSGDKEQLKNLYPGLHEIFTYASGQKSWPSGENLDETNDGLISPSSGGSGLDDSPSQVWTRGYGVDWARQNYYWNKPLEVNPTGKLLRTASVNMTAFALLSAKLLQQICNVLEIETPETYQIFIDKSENSLQKYAWNKQTGHFHWTVKDSGNQCPYYDLSGITPLFSASYNSPEQKETLLDNLLNIYLTEYGLTTVNQKADFFRVGYWCGAIWLPFHWLFWKTLLGLGRLEDAEKVAMLVVENYGRNYEKFPVCYEKFDLESGQGCGDFSFSGLGGIVLNLWGGYRKPGTVSFGFFVIPEKIIISNNLLNAELKLSCSEKTASTAILIVLKPDQVYKITINRQIQKLQSNKFGCLEFVAPIAKDNIISISIEHK